MNKEIAERIKELRVGKCTHSWRLISEAIYQEFPEFIKTFDPKELRKTNQSQGQEFCKHAIEFLKVPDNEKILWE